ncbi:MAG: hypothetical protein ACRDFW_14615, partial [bacterium]
MRRTDTRGRRTRSWCRPTTRMGFVPMLHSNSALSATRAFDPVAVPATGPTRNDQILGGLGRDHVHGDAGNDVLYGGSGSDHVRGGDG